MPEPFGLDDVIKGATKTLEAAGIDQAQLEARRLISAAAELNPTVSIMQPNVPLSPRQLERVKDWLAQRAARIPLARIQGRTDFYGRTFHISQATLEPRCDTETLIDVMLHLVDASHGRAYPWTILDVGTGSGCLLVTLLAELTQAVGLGTDVSGAALRIARRNAYAQGVGDRARWCRSNYLDSVVGPFDLLVSNPPYIRRGDIAQLQDEVRLCDPRVALEGGEDGLDGYRRLCDGLLNVVPNGKVVLEIADNDAQRVKNVIASRITDTCWTCLGVWPDLTGFERCVAIETLC